MKLIGYPGINSEAPAVEILDITRPIIFFDTETTGQEPKEDRIVELGFMQVKPNGEIYEWQGFVNPEMPIPHEATYGNPARGYEGHGITDDMVKDAPTFKVLAERLHGPFSECDFGGTNIRGYDLPLLKAEFERVGKPWSYDDASILDSHRLEQFLEPRDLSTMVRKYLKRDHTGAHRALDDIKASYDVVLQQLLAAAGRLPLTPKGIHELLYPPRPKRPNWIDPQGKIQWKDGAATVMFGRKWTGTRLDLMSRRDLQWIAYTATGMSPEVKAICKDALDGIFPKKEG